MIEHRLTRPRTPQTNGMVERFNGRIADILKTHHFMSGEDLEQTLLRYAMLYNELLPQTALNSKTPRPS
jgi:transposase InsO family protein